MVKIVYTKREDLNKPKAQRPRYMGIVKADTLNIMSLRQAMLTQKHLAWGSFHIESAEKIPQLAR